MAARACPAVAGVSETGRVPPGMHDGVWSGSGGFSWGTVRLGICLFVSIWHLGRFSGCVGVPEGSPDCVCWYWFCWSLAGRGFWREMASVQRFCEEGGRWVTFLYEKMDVMGGVSDVGTHERV